MALALAELLAGTDLDGARARIRGNIENTGNGDLANPVLDPVEQTIPASSRYTLLQHCRGEMLDHMLSTRNLLAHHRGAEIHNEILHGPIAVGTGRKHPSPTTRP